MALEKERYVDELLDKVEEFLDALKVEKGASPHTILAYRNDLTQIANFLHEEGMTSWSQLNEEIYLRWEATLSESAPSTAQRRASSFRSFLKYLVRKGMKLKMELPQVTRARSRARLPKALPLDVLLRLLSAPDVKSSVGMRDRTMMEMIYGAGLRISEVCNLREQDIDFENATIRVEGKRNRVRYVPIPEITLQWIERYVREVRPRLMRRPTGQLILNRQGKQLTRQAGYMALQKHVAAAGLDQKVSPHTLRHTYAVHLVHGGADLRSVQELLGHQSINTTQVYTMLDLAKLEERYNVAHPRS